MRGGHTVVKVKIYNPHDSSRFMELELLVDTGSTYAWIKRDRLEKLGVKPIDRRKFKTIEGRVIERGEGRGEVYLLTSLESISYSNASLQLRFP